MLYKHCCKRFHDGTPAPTALDLMRSRYSAYALKLIDYIINTTHPQNPGRKPKINIWKKELMQFAQSTSFDGLRIIEFTDSGQTATVTFTAHLRQGGRDAGFTEKSYFEKVDGRWMYKNGDTQKVLS